MQWMKATRKIIDILNNFKEVLGNLKEENVRKWVEDLILIKTYGALMLHFLLKASPFKAGRRSVFIPTVSRQF